MSTYFHSASQSCLILSANCRHNLRLFRLFRGDSSGMDKSSSAKRFLYSDVVKGKPSPTGTGRTKKKPWRKRQSRSWRFSFVKFFIAFFYLFLFFKYFTLSFFSILFLPTTFTHTHTHTYTHDPRPLPTTHDPRPTTFSYTREDNMLFSHVEISSFRAKAHLIFHWCLSRENELRERIPVPDDNCF